MPRPRVGFDATSLGAFGKGVARYARELLPELAALADEVETVVLAPPGAELPEGLGPQQVAGVRTRPAIAWEQLGLPRVARTAGLDLVHTTSDRLPVSPRPPIVLYLFEDPVYRLAAARGARSARKTVADVLTRTLYPRSLRRAGLLLVSSHATARDVCERGIPERKVRVVYPGVAARFRPAADEAERASVRRRFDAPDGYVLHFSSDDPRDNTTVALEAYARLASPPPLLIAGPVAARRAPQQERARELGIAGSVRWLGFLGGDDLHAVYRGASAFVDPSLYEGFGFQVAEALASGAPVVCSNTTSLPEVVGDAGVLLAPDDVDGFAEALTEVLTNAEVARRLREAGPVQASRFDWAETARATVAAWRELTG